jgi:hypothetical protein
MRNCHLLLAFAGANPHPAVGAANTTQSQPRSLGSRLKRPPQEPRNRYVTHHRDAAVAGWSVAEARRQQRKPTKTDAPRIYASKWPSKEPRPSALCQSGSHRLPDDPSICGDHEGRDDAAPMRNAARKNLICGLQCWPIPDSVLLSRNYVDQAFTNRSNTSAWQSSPGRHQQARFLPPSVTRASSSSGFCSGL